MTNQRQRPKIALIGYRLSGGGSERVMANLSLFLERNEIDVHCIIVLNETGYSYGGKLLNLGLLKDKSNGFYNKWVRFKVLKKYLADNRFDYIIDFRFRTKIIQELLLSRWVYNTKTIFTVHSFLINHYMPYSSWLTRIMYGKSFATVAINNQIKDLIEAQHKLNNVVRIYNPIPIEEIKRKAEEEELVCEFEYVVAVGRLDDSLKQFDVLIACYAKSQLPQKNIHLTIVGEGNLKPELQQFAVQLKVDAFVHFVGFQANPFKYLKNAKFTLLTSVNEGMPMVLLESLACETPVVAFDCDSGPREIIQNNENGFLVENQNKEKLIEAMNLMVSDSELYVNCKKNALQSVQKFSLEIIGTQWLNLMQIKNNP